MKVIKAGNPQKGWAKKFTCSGNGNGGGGCSAVLMVEQGDVFLTHSSHYDGSNETYKTFECPSCGVLTDIPTSVYVPGPIGERPKKPGSDSGDR